TNVAPNYKPADLSVIFDVKLLARYQSNCAVEYVYINRPLISDPAVVKQPNNISGIYTTQL
ncbi:MAG: hypothetical protein ACKPKO_22585, partial [Candidatus Fonsibacter sp.]